MAQGLTDSEEFVNSISQRAFLELWTHPNPKGKKRKELCDCLIVCGNHIVIISVKYITYKDTGDKVGWERWIKDAIDKSASQIWGAERWLNTSESFERHDGRVVGLPPIKQRIYHRVSVSLGGKREIPTKAGDLGHGIVHVCDEYSLGVVFGLLDTITDFVNFLSGVESIISNDTRIIFAGGGLDDFVAIYLLNGYSFPFEKVDMMIVDDSIFKGFIESDDYKSMQEDYKNSYFWDSLIEQYTKDLLTDGMFDFTTRETTDNQLALLQMVLQSRGHRANLAEAFIEFFEKPELKIASRVVLAYENTAFVFLVGKSSEREVRVQELGLRCLVVRGIHPEVKIVVGIAADRPGTSEIGYSSDIVYIDIQDWTKELDKEVESIQKEFGYFENAKWGIKKY